jgi:protein-export membrane protein SecD
MPEYWRLKVLSILIAILGSIYMLVPGMSGWVDLGEKPFYAMFFPEKGLNLGLDLRGGIYIEFDVELEEALSTRADILHSEMNRLLKKDKIVLDVLERVSETNHIRASAENTESLDRFRKYINAKYSDTFKIDLDQSSENSVVIVFLDNFLKRIKDQTLEQAVRTIRGRIDKYGVTEPSIQRLGNNKIAVELPGVKDPDRAIELIKKGGKLEFHMVDESKTTAELDQMIQTVRDEKKLEGYSDKVLEEINSSLKDKIAEDTEITYEVIYDPITHDATSGIPYLLKKKAEVTGDMLADAQVQVQSNEPFVSLTFDNRGAVIFSELTANNIGKRLAIVLDGRVSSAPEIQSKIPNGRAQITLGGGTYQGLFKEAEDLTLILREGALPATLIERAKSIIGPSLGKISIEKGVQALLMSGAFVLLFMLIYYRLSGLFADVSLIVNVLLIFAVLTLFQATLTLPGLAGIILTVGMAVDANIIVFERIREEIRDGKNPRVAVLAGYDNAMSAIIDANVTTFLVGIILYQYGTGPVRGFAVTLMIGIVTTLFTALVMTKTIQIWNVFIRKVEKLSI